MSATIYSDMSLMLNMFYKYDGANIQIYFDMIATCLLLFINYWLKMLIQS